MSLDIQKCHKPVQHFIDYSQSDEHADILHGSKQYKTIANLFTAISIYKKFKSVSRSTLKYLLLFLTFLNLHNKSSTLGTEILFVHNVRFENQIISKQISSSVIYDLFFSALFSHILLNL